jgi:hypothetical protein
MITLSRREFLQGTGALVVGFAVPSLAHAQRLSRTEAALGKTLDTGDVDGFIAVNADGSVTIYSGKVDLGQGRASPFRRWPPRSSASTSGGSRWSRATRR